MKIHGELLDWFETGLEGVVWAIEPNDAVGFDLNVIHEGDHLTILDRDGRVLWQGVIQCDREIGKIPRPTNPDFVQQAALGCWIHWVQRGFEPDQWAAFFIRPEGDRYRGILEMKEQSIPTACQRAPRGR